MILPITLTIAAACAAINLWLALRVSRARMTQKVMVGDGGEGPLQTAARAHANFAEYAPFVIILIVLIELAGGSPTWLWTISAVFVVARVAHALGMPRRAPNPLRAGGILVTWLVLAILAGWALTFAYGVTAPRTIEAVPVEALRG